jgi:hypothetical protein
MEADRQRDGDEDAGYIVVIVSELFSGGDAADAGRLL